VPLGVLQDAAQMPGVTCGAVSMATDAVPPFRATPSGAGCPKFGWMSMTIGTVAWAATIQLARLGRHGELRHRGQVQRHAAGIQAQQRQHPLLVQPRVDEEELAGDVSVRIMCPQ
jgi:hypothetical protein